VSPRRTRLGGDPDYEIRIVPEAIAEFRDHPEAKRLLETCIDILGKNPTRPHKRKAGLMRGHEPVRKFRPPGLGTIRVYYAIDEEDPTLV